MADALPFDESGYLDLDGFDDVDPDGLGEVGLEVSTALDGLVDPPLPDETWDAMVDHAVEGDAEPVPAVLLGDDPDLGDDPAAGDEAVLDLDDDVDPAADDDVETGELDWTDDQPATPDGLDDPAADDDLG